METLTDEQREISKIEIQIEVCRREKDALRYQLQEANRKPAEQNVQRIAFGFGLVIGFGLGGMFTQIIFAIFGSR